MHEKLLCTEIHISALKPPIKLENLIKIAKNTMSRTALILNPLNIEAKDRSELISQSRGHCY